MSSLQVTETMVPECSDTRVPERTAERPAPYQPGDKISATSPEGTRYLVRVEAVTPTAGGQFAIVGSVTAPRKYRSHLLSTTVGADGFGPAVRPAV